MTDKHGRRHKRYAVKDVQGTLFLKVRVSVSNISLNGMAVETTERLKLGRTYTLKLTDGGEPVDVDGKVVWCHLTGTRRQTTGESTPIYQAGLTFEGILTERARRLAEFMGEHVVLATEKRVLGRFRMQKDAPVQLQVADDFEVKQLSLSGMLIETRMALPVESRFELELNLQEGSLTLSGRVAYSERVGGTDEEPLSKLGVEFVGMTEPSRAALKEYLSQELG